MRRLLALFAVLGLVTAACGDDDGGGGGGGAGSGADLEGRTFLSQSVTHHDQDAPVVVPADAVRLEFTAEGEIRVHAGCNHLFGTIESTADGVLAISTVGGTEMGCPEDLHARDQLLIDFLTSQPTWHLDGDTLELGSASLSMILLDRRVADPDRSLEGTRWVVDTIIDGESVSSLPTDAVAHLYLEGGTLTGDTGCNDLSGSYRAEGDLLYIDQLTQTDVACGPDVTTLEEAVLAIGESPLEVGITAGRLTLTNPSGRGIGLHAE